jgi:Protein of unknown function (DUF3467)
MDRSSAFSNSRRTETWPMSNPVEGRYANYFKIGHNAFELIIDFGQCYGEKEEPTLHTRIVTSPAYGKELLKALRQCLEENEKLYGSDEPKV